MVFYFTCSDPRYIIYMGRDKMENEHLIAHGWPEDLWFHVDKHSSAHVYLRLPKGDNFDRSFVSLSLPLVCCPCLSSVCRYRCPSSHVVSFPLLSY